MYPPQTMMSGCDRNYLRCAVKPVRVVNLVESLQERIHDLVSRGQMLAHGNRSAAELSGFNPLLVSILTFNPSKALWHFRVKFPMDPKEKIRPGHVNFRFVL